MTETAATFDLNKHTARLLMNEPFFAALSRRINKAPTTAISTAGVKVCKHTGQLEMIYNPEFFAKLTDDQKLGVLKHEFYHLVFGHVTGRLPSEGMSKKWNIATDLSINSHLQNELPEGCCMPGHAPFEYLPAYKSAEWYMANLREPEQGEGDGDGEGGDGEGEGSGGGGWGEPMDDHSGWGEVPSEVKEIAKERLREAMKKAADEASQSGSWGTVSSECRKKIMDAIHPKIDWRKVLRYFVKTSQRSNKRATVRRLNKRYPFIHQGRKVTRQAKIAISIDQSGSVSDKELAAFFTELNKLSDLAEFTVIPFDTQVAEDKVYIWKQGERKTWERVLSGGTCFDAPTKYVNERTFDGHIVLTDLMAPKPVASKCQRMWMASRANVERPYFQTNERMIAIDA